jgi:penicillin-binding protein 1A
VAGVVLLAAIVLGATTTYLVVSHYSADLPSIVELKSGYSPLQLTRVLAKDGTVLADLFTERRTVIPFKDVPDGTKLAFLAAEDASFYEHKGLDYLGMLRALSADLRAGATRQGGSTCSSTPSAP